MAKIKFLTDSASDITEELEKKLDYKWWYAGHYHTSRVRDKVQIMFEDIEEFLNSILDYQ